MSQAPDQVITPVVGEPLQPSNTFTLRVLSPSIGATVPISIRIEPTNTVKDLKLQIRDALPIHPTDDRQRLIYQGRALLRDNETMTEIFGEERIKNPEVQTVHLVLRDLPPAINSSSVTARSVAANGISSNDQAVSDNLMNAGSHIPESPAPNVPAAGGFGHTAYQLLEELQNTQQQIDAIRRRGQLDGQETRDDLAAQRDNTPPAATSDSPLSDTERHVIRARQILLGERQRGGNGAQRIQSRGRPLNPSRLQNGPVDSVTYSQRGVTSNGERWEATVTESTTVVTNNLPHIIQSILNDAEHERVRRHLSSRRNEIPDNTPEETTFGRVDVTAGATVPETVRLSRRHSETPFNTSALNMTVASNSESDHLLAAQQGGASPPPFVAGHPPSTHSGGQQQFDRGMSSAVDTGPGEITNVQPNSTSTETQISQPNPRSEFSTMSTPPHTAIQSVASGSAGPTVYILSSPVGPQALLIAPSPNGIESFFTPRQTSFSNIRDHRQEESDAAVDRRDRRRMRHVRHHRNDHEAGPVQPVAPPAPLGHQQNPPAGAAMAEIWPHIWLMARLIGFVWFFTSGNTSWWRTIAVSGVAMAVFIYNIGVLNGIAAQIWDPIRGHLEALLPLAGPPPAPGAQAPAPALAALDVNPNDNAAAAGAVAGQDPTPRTRRAPRAPTPDPAQVAARLMEERRRADGNWLWAQVRRMEHAALLFLASLIPGVGERHIIARAVEENIVREAEAARQVQIREAMDAESPTLDSAHGEDATNSNAGDDEISTRRERDTAEGNNEPHPDRLIDV